MIGDVDTITRAALVALGTLPQRRSAGILPIWALDRFVRSAVTAARGSSHHIEARLWGRAFPTARAYRLDSDLLVLSYDAARHEWAVYATRRAAPSLSLVLENDGTTAVVQILSFAPDNRFEYRSKRITYVIPPPQAAACFT